MATLLLFAMIVVFALAFVTLIGGFRCLLDPFNEEYDGLIGLAVILLVFPAILTGGFAINKYRSNYYPPLEPITAPELATS